MIEMSNSKMKLSKYSFMYFFKNWKLIIHLIFRTYKFGVNNNWWCEHHSIFGLPWYKRFEFLKNYKMMKFRVFACHFLTDDEKKIIYKEK